LAKDDQLHAQYAERLPLI